MRIQYGRLYSIFGSKATLLSAYLVFGVGCMTTYVSHIVQYRTEHHLTVRKEGLRFRYGWQYSVELSLGLVVPEWWI